jgi:hypothetical protein
MAMSPIEVRQDFARLMSRLVLNPRDTKAGVKQLKTAPGGFTAPFDDALLVYQILRDYPRIQLLLVRWDVSAADD